MGEMSNPSSLVGKKEVFKINDDDDDDESQKPRYSRWNFVASCIHVELQTFPVLSRYL